MPMPRDTLVKTIDRGFVKAAIGLSALVGLWWFANAMLSGPVDCANGYELGFRLFWGQGRAITCLCIPPEKRRDVTC